MTSTIGYVSIWLAVSFSVLQFFITLNQKKNTSKLKFKIAAIGILLSTSLSFFSLMFSHIISDFSILNVIENSHTTKPMIYKISGVWGNHEGSMLLWVLVLSITNYFIYRLYNKKNYFFISKTLQIQSLINLGFLLFIVFTSNPFEKVLNPLTDGLGFNPILQDPALAIHPPLLYFGYVGFSAAFSLSIAALHLEHNSSIQWNKYMKPFVIAAWTFLTAGIAFGSIWAYYELGWGGWWFWDPVENAALMPWLLATALMHSLITVERKQSLKNWVLLLSILTFLLSVTGTFLVRSGILTSVHTFALDPTRGSYILLFVTLLGGYSLILFSIKSKNFSNRKFFSFLSKEGSILINNLVMTVICFSVFFGTIYPLFVEIFSSNRISIGEPYFNSTVIPIFFPALLIMGIVPLQTWGKLDINKIIKQTFICVFLTLLIVGVFFLLYKKFNLLGLIGISLSFWIICNILIKIIIDIKNDNEEKIFSIKYFTKYLNSMNISHLGVGLLILGITSSSIWQEENIVRMKLNDQTKIFNYDIIFKEINTISESNYLALEGSFSVLDKNKKLVTVLKPQNRIYTITNSSTSEVAINTNLLRDLYIVLGEGNLKDGWVIRIYYNPLVIWIWIGVSIIFIGGLISLKKNLRILKKY